jgi:hypothetical protein
MWIQELNLLRGEILGRLQTAVGSEVVRDIRFIKGALNRRERPKLKAVPRPTRQMFELPKMRDPDLKRAFERLIEAWGRSPR